MEDINSDSSEIDDLNYKRKKVEELGSTLAQIRARMKSYRSCSKKEESFPSGSSPPVVSERSAYLKQLLEEDKAKIEKLERERPKMEEEVDKLLIEHEQFKQLMKELDTNQEPESPELEVPEVVRKRMVQMESTIHMLQESLSEKDKVLKSKTEALQLLNQQIAQRSTEAIENSKLMAKEFERTKAIQAKREQVLKEELEACQQRLNEAQSLVIERQNEKYDFDKLNSELETLKSTHAECENKYLEVKKALDSERKIAIKLKAQYKNLKNEKTAKNELAAEVEQLQQLVASLEEEKGNLMLQLVDFEEMKESSVSNLNKVKDLERALEITTDEFSSFKESYHVLKHDYDDATARIKDLKTELDALKESTEFNKHLKIVAEMKAVELEEKLDFLNKDVDRTQQDKVNKELGNLKCYISELELNITSLKESLEAKENEIMDLKKIHYPQAEECSVLNHSELNNLLTEWKEKYALVEESIIRTEEEKVGLLEKISQIQEELELLKSQNQLLSNELESKEALISNSEATNKELTTSLKECQEKILHLETQLKAPEGAKEGGAPQDQTLKLRKLAANLKNKVKVCKELEIEVASLKATISENTKCIDKLTEEKSELKKALENVKVFTDVDRRETVEEIKQMLLDEDPLISSLEKSKNKDLLAVVKDCAQRVRAESFSEISEKETEIKHLKEENLLLESRLNENLMEIHSVEEPELKESPSAISVPKVEEKETIESQIAEYSHQITELTNEIKLKNDQLSLLEKANEELENKLANITLSNLESLKIIEEQQEQLNIVKKELEEVCLCKDKLIDDNNELLNLRETVQVLETELSKSNETILSKEEMINFFQSEMEALKQDISESETRLGGLQNMCQNESYILSEKLQEKESYISSLEEDLDDMKNKVHNLEARIKEGQRIMEEQVAQLGGRLNEAEIVNSTMEEYRREMDFRNNQFLENEKQLRNEISELVSQLDRMKSTNEELSKRNSDLEASDKQLKDNISILDTELSDIKNAYNTTLDQIELLNGELNQVMSQIEHRNGELVRITGERKSMAEKINELENACSDLRAQLQSSEMESENLKCELDTKLKMLEEASAEITNLQAQLGTSQTSDSQALNLELESLRQEYEQRLKELKVQKDDLVNVLPGNSEEEVDSLMKGETKVEEGGVQMFTWQDDSSNPFESKETGWDFPEAKFEEESGMNQYPPLQELLNKKEHENTQLKEELKTIQVKCAKLASKLKEMKALVKKLESSKTSATGFGDLDFAVQEELRSQIDSLETKNKELSSDLNSLKLEKERLLKRVDTLTSANEQFVENKERQDIEVLMWQRKFSDLKTQLETFEWTSDMQDEGPKESDKSDKLRQELEEKVSALESENDELQQIICSFKDTQTENSKLVSELNCLKEEINNLKSSNPEIPKVTFFADNQFSSDEEVAQLKSLLEAERNTSLECNKSIEKLLADKDELQRKVQSLSDELQEYHSRLNPLTSQVDQLTSANESLQSEISSLKYLQKRNDECEAQINQLLTTVQQVEELKMELFNLQNEISNLNNVIQDLNAQNSSLNKLCESQTIELENLQTILAKEKRVEVKEEFKKTDSSVSEISPMNLPGQETAPPIFKGFFSDGDDPFATVSMRNQQAPSSLNETDEINNLVSRIKELEEENIKLIKRIDSFSESISESDLCKQQLNHLSEELVVLSNSLKKVTEEKDTVVKENETQREIIHQLESQVTQWKDQVSSLQIQFGELQNFHAQQIENIKLSGIQINEERISQEYEHRETEFKNALLAKDEENAHLVCEISSKSQLCEKLTNEISQLKSLTENLQSQVLEAKQINDTLAGEKQAFEEEYKTIVFELNNLKGSAEINSQQYIAKVDYLTQMVQEKESTVESLTHKCEEFKKVISKLEEDLQDFSSKCSHLEKEKENLQEELKSSTDECRNFYEKLSLLTQEKELTDSTMRQLVDELNAERVRLQEVSVEIETLRTGESGRLQSLVEKVEFLEAAITEKDMEIERLSKLLTGLQEKLIETENANSSDQVIQLKMKLDEVFYTLHLRDVRCDELTMEIMRLLEERDSLQLRLSDALRESESLKGKKAPVSQQESLHQAVPPNPKQKELYEVRTGYMKDPDVKMDMQSRHSQQMQLLSKQSTSNTAKDATPAGKPEETSDYGIFNWFFGSSTTPVVMQDQT